MLLAGVSVGLGAALQHGGVISSRAGLFASCVCASMLFVAIMVEVLKGGHGPIILAELEANRKETELSREEMKALRKQLTDVEGLMAAVKTSADSAIRDRLSGSGTGSGTSSGRTGNYPAQ